MGMVRNGRGVNVGSGAKRPTGQWVVYETVELSMRVWCEAAEGSMVMV